MTFLGEIPYDLVATQKTLAPAIAMPWCTQDQTCAKKNRLNAATVKANKVTTLMIHNLPTTLSQEDVRDQLDNDGFGKLFDFLYVPFNLKTMSICGYAFINLVSSDAAALLVSMWDNASSLCDRPTDKSMFFSAAAVQGQESPSSLQPLLVSPDICTCWTLKIPSLCSCRRQGK